MTPGHTDGQRHPCFPTVMNTDKTVAIKPHETRGREKRNLAGQTKRKVNHKANLTRLIALILAVMLLGSILLAAALSNFIY